MNILDPIFYRTLFYDFRPVISPGNFGPAFVIFGVRFLSGVEDLLRKIVAPSLGFKLNKVAQI
jgi:hypothetical protein